ncbi:MAG: MerR family DNA-binding protein [Acidimicrobiales bacterium]
MLPEPARTAGGYREYRVDDAERLAFIRRSQLAGFRLHDIRQVLAIADTGEPACQHVAALLDERLRDVDARIADLRRTREHLTELALRAAAQDPAECHGYCQILSMSRQDIPTSSSMEIRDQSFAARHRWVRPRMAGAVREARRHTLTRARSRGPAHRSHRIDRSAGTGRPNQSSTSRSRSPSWTRSSRSGRR